MARYLEVATRTFLIAIASWMAEPVYACNTPAQGTHRSTVDTRQNASGRAVALVHINGQGPFRFVIDTGANRSVISLALARRLRLPHSGLGVVHSVDSAELAMLVDVESLSFGPLRLSGGEVPVLDGAMLDGEHGLLGVDGMVGRLLHLDFMRNCAEIYDRPAELHKDGWLSVPARVRFGSLLLIQGTIMGVRVNVLLDTGSNISLANERFRDSLRDVGARRIQYRDGHAFTFGRPIVLAQKVWAPRLHMGRTIVDGVNAFIGNYHIFDVWGLQDEPTILIGMDVLARSRQMAIDYENGVVYFRKPPRSSYRGEIKPSRPRTDEGSGLQ
jgi:predicted aspartyl protease